MSDPFNSDLVNPAGRPTPGWLAAQQRHDLCIRLPDTATQDANPNQSPRPSDTSQSMLFVRIPNGSFRVGSRGYSQREQPVCEVVLSDFYLGVFPVTQSQFAVWRPDHANWFSGVGRSRHPAESISWFDAVSYCEWLNATCVSQLPSGYRFCLPSECQWEYACRLSVDKSGQRQILEMEYYTGDGVAALEAAGWYDGNSESKTHPVGQKAGTSLGLYDLHGNVEEWCRDAWSDDPYFRYDWGEEDPEVRAADVGKSESDAHRVFRGGSWDDTSGNCRAACRFGGPVDGYRDRGFRVCACSGPRAVQPR